MIGCRPLFGVNIDPAGGSVRFSVRRVRRSVADAQLPYNSAFMPGSCVGDRETRTDGERRELLTYNGLHPPVR
jgi:hypothetical protein